MAEEKRYTGFKVFVGVLGFALLMVVCTSGNRSDTADEGEAVGAWVVCQQFLEDRLKAPSTAKYPTSYPDYTEDLGNGRFRVDAYVDAENSFGAMIRTFFTCTVRYAGNDRWTLEALDTT